VPTGRVKWYNSEKGYGFLSQEEGEDVYVGSSALPSGVEDLKAGQKVEFGIAAGRRGPQALSLKVIDPPPSLTRTRRDAATVEHKHTPDAARGRGAARAAQGKVPGPQDRPPGIRGSQGRRARTGRLTTRRA
jgi:CspA family cold shock protein